MSIAAMNEKDFIRVLRTVLDEYYMPVIREEIKQEIGRHFARVHEVWVAHQVATVEKELAK